MTQPNVELDQPFLPRYQVESFVGEGGAARIYKVVDQRDGAVRAIKALKPEANAEPSIVERFENEFLILRRLHHPSLPEIYDYGFTEHGIRYIVMEFVKGQQLDVYYKEHREDLWLLLYELCEVLTFIHDRDLLHLDLKPANILVKRTSAYGDQKPMVVLMDFGLSYRRDVGGERSLVGTPEYMAPEIIRGDGRLTRAADYYSLGIILYELLTGETPFRGEMSEIFAGHLKQEVRFRQEKTENAELYPHVLGLVKKDINPRLEGFEEFRRAVTGRMTGGIDELAKSYGLSVVSSIGLVGKDNIWDANLRWSKEIADRIKIIPQNESDESNPAPPKAPLDHVPNRLHLLNGPVGTGKTYLLEEMAAYLQIRGLSVWRFTSSDDFPIGPNVTVSSLTHSEIEQLREHVDPGALVYEQYISAWKELTSDARIRGVVLLVDDFDRLNSRQRGYLEYLLRRIMISSREISDFGVYLFLTCRNITTFRALSEELFTESHSSFHISPLTPADLEIVLNQMRCTPVTEDDRRNLVDYLSPLDDSIGSTITALEDLSLKGQLLFANDRWTFRSPGRPKTTTRKTVIRDYYRDIFSQLNHQERELLKWTCCHRGPVAFDVLLEVSPFNESDIDSCLDNLKTYRLLDQAPRDGIRCLEISSKNIHNTIYNLIATKRKTDIHDLYSRYYEKRSTTEPENGLDTATSTSLQLVHQYRGARNYRPLLLTQIRLARALETNSQLIALRTICEEGISALSTINSDRWQQQVLAVIRFLVVKLVDACWILNDFDTLRHVVSAQYKTSPHRIPIRTFLKYSLSLVYSSNYDSVLTTARAIRHAYPLQNSQAHVTADLVDAIVMLENAKLSNASALLQRVESFSNKLDDYGRCRLLTSYVILYDKLDNERASRKYIPLLERYSKQMGFIHEHLIGATARFNLSFKKSQLSECKAIIKRSVRLAMKHRMYYRLADWHFLASAVYYEEGSYAKSIHHVEQCLQMFERLGQAFKLPEMLTRISMNYYHAGLYGNSVRYIERAIRLWNPQWNAAEGAVIFLFALEIHIAINSKHVARYNKISKQYLDRHPEVSRWGYYWHLSGLHNHQLGNNALALKDFERSRIDEERKGAIDDAVRSGMKEAFALIDLGKMDKVGNLVLYLRKLSRSLESKNIEAELKVLELSYHYFKRSPRSVINRHIKAVEDVRDQAKEVPVLLIIDKILFRVKARHGEVDSSKAAFRRYLKTLKSISDNIQDRDDALAFLGRDDEKLALQEYKLICNK